MEKNSTSSVDREENEFYSFGGTETQKLLEAAILRLKLCYFGHVMRVERDIMLAQVAGYRRQGKPWMRWLDNIKEATGLWLDALKEAVQIGKNGACWWRKRLRIGNAQM